MERVAGLVKLAEKRSEINQQYEFWKKIDPSMCTFLDVKWCTIIAFVGGNVSGQSVFRILLIFGTLKSIWKPMYFMIDN